MTDIVLPAYGWRPRHYQMPAWRALENGCKRLALAWHRRAGKDDLCLHWAACAAMQRVGAYWHMLPQHNQARKAIWDAVNPKTGRRRIDDAFPPEIRATTREQDMFIRLKNGATWQVVGSDTYNALVGSPPVGVVFSEYALADPSAWAFLRPILAENNGWALFISTPRGRNHFARMIEYAKSDADWFGQVLTVDDTQAIAQDIIERERRELTAERGHVEAEAIIQQEYYCSFEAAIPGAYYGYLMTEAERKGRISTDIRWDKDRPVMTAWDLGIGDSTAIWFFQQSGDSVRVIDYLEGSGVGLQWYADQLRARPYKYAYTAALLPHDAGVSELGTGKRRVDVLAEMGVRGRILPRTSLDDGIQAVRSLLPRCYFSAQPIPVNGESEADAKQRMDRGLDALRQYQREWSDSLMTFRDKPLHDWTSHPADAFRYLALGIRDISAEPENAPRGVKPYTIEWLMSRDDSDRTVSDDYYR